MNVKEVLREINKETENTSFDTAIRLTNYYLNYFFEGTEHDLLKKKYADFIFVEYWDEGRKLYYDYDNLQNITQRLGEKAVWLARKKYRDYCEKCLDMWKKNINAKIAIVEDKLVQSLLTFFTINDEKFVKELLGLNYSMDLIKEKIKELK